MNIKPNSSNQRSSHLQEKTTKRDIKKNQKIKKLIKKQLRQILITAIVAFLSLFTHSGRHAPSGPTQYPSIYLSAAMYPSARK